MWSKAPHLSEKMNENHKIPGLPGQSFDFTSEYLMKLNKNVWRRSGIVSEWRNEVCFENKTRLSSELEKNNFFIFSPRCCFAVDLNYLF